MFRLSFYRAVLLIAKIVYFYLVKKVTGEKNPFVFVFFHLYK